MRWCRSRRRIHTQTQPNDRTIVVQVEGKAGTPLTYKINETPVEKRDLLAQAH